MAFTRNTAPPNLAANWRVFDPGDSGLTAVTRLAAFNELQNRMIVATREFNASNSLQLPQFQFNIDGDVNEMTAGGTLEYRIDVDPTTGDQTKEYVNYIEPYLAWTVPTTGDLKGQATPQAALTYMLRQLNRLNDSITPGRLFGDPRGLVTLDENASTNLETFTVAGVPVVASESGTGQVIFEILEYGIISDVQHGIVV
jgi:hypothetical protein